MHSVEDILRASGLRLERYKGWPAGKVFLSAANQLFGAYAEFTSFKRSSKDYKGWQAHHVVETQGLERLGISRQFPMMQWQLCVLLPERAHIGRINSVLRNQNPTAVTVTSQDLRHAYADAYALIGDYCGGGEANIKRELLDIVAAVFRLAGLR